MYIVEHELCLHASFLFTFIVMVSRSYTLRIKHDGLHTSFSAASLGNCEGRIKR